MADTFLIHVHPDVELDFSDAYHWYETQQQGLGGQFIISVRNKLHIIANSPELFGNKGKQQYREVKVKGFPYIIVYKVFIREKRIFVSAIHHTSKSPGKKYRRP
jgi:hypothetical protein